jgi:hypothetical protein
MKMEATCFSEMSIHFSILNMMVVVSSEKYAFSSALKSEAAVSSVILSTLAYTEDGSKRFLRNTGTLLYPEDGDSRFIGEFGTQCPGEGGSRFLRISHNFIKTRLLLLGTVIKVHTLLSASTSARDIGVCNAMQLILLL